MAMMTLLAVGQTHQLPTLVLPALLVRHRLVVAVLLGLLLLWAVRKVRS